MSGAGLYVPEISPDMDMLTAAMGYADAGWYVLPAERGTKDPGSVVGKRWQDKSSRDPKQITAWFAGTDHDIALHCGRSGAVVFDVDDPDKLPDVLRKHRDTAPYQSTRPDTPGRGHYIFAQPQSRTIGNGVGRLGGGWGDVRGLNGVIIAAPSHHAEGGEYRWMNTSPPGALDGLPQGGAFIFRLPDELADLLDDASPADDAASDAAVVAFIAEHQSSTRPNVLQGLVAALRKRFDAGESRHQSTVSALTGAMKESRIGVYTAQGAIDALRPMFLDAVTRPPASGKQGPARSRQEAEGEFDGILAWAVGQALGANPDEIHARVEGKMPNNTEWVDDTTTACATGDGDDHDDDHTVKTVPWPTLPGAALYGTAGEIVRLVAPHTEADPAAILVQLHAEFGATLGSGPHFIAGNERHQAIIHPLIVGRTNNGAKGTSLAVVEAIRREAVLTFEECTTSGLSTAEGLIELVRDPSGDPDDERNYDPGVEDKRLLVTESEYKSVLVRQRRDGNTLGQILRDAWDCKTLRTLARKSNKLTATRPHIVVIGHVTPGEFRATLEDSDLSGGSVNRLLICLSRRSRLNPRLGNLPAKVLTDAGDLFNTAYNASRERQELKFTEGFWESWDRAYRELNRDRPDSRATAATARAVTQVLRLSLLYALFDGKPVINDDHLEAALALWSYADHSARWVFSNHELEKQRESVGGLANFILSGGASGRTRTEISRDHFKRNKTAAEINAELVPLVHDGVVVEIKDETGARQITRYVHRSLRINESTKHADQAADPVTNRTNYVRTVADPGAGNPGGNSYEFVNGSYDETASGLQNSFDSLIRTAESEDGTNPDPPGGVTEATRGYTDRVEAALAKARKP